MVALLAVVAAGTGPPLPVLHSRGESLTAALGSSCWISPPDEHGIQQEDCGDGPPPVTQNSLTVRPRSQVRIDMRTKTDSLFVSVRGRDRRLRAHRAGESKRRFVVRLPRHLKDGAVLDLFGRYPQGDGAFGARLRVP
jgi:hypothetical protein